MTTHLQRLQALIEADVWPTDPDECILWTAAGDRSGYGQLTVKGRTQKVHRLMHCMSAGIDLADVSTDSAIVHTCQNRSCYRPSHLRMMRREYNREGVTVRGEGITAQPRIPWGPLEVFLTGSGQTNTDNLHRGTGVKAKTFNNWREQGWLRMYRADEVAVKLGCHPSQIWGDWYERTDLESLGLVAVK